MTGVVATRPEPTEAPWLGAILETIGDFGEASVGLVAWELSLPEQALAAAWRQAVSQRLIEEVGRCPETAELMYRLAPFPAMRAGRRILTD